MKILLIEDDERTAQAVARGLTSEGFEVEVTHDGADGLWMATEGSFDLILLDVMLPGMNGFMVCRELRAREIWTPILMLTAKDGEYDIAEALDTGADDYMSKPFSFTVLTARVRALLRRTAPVGRAPIAVGDLRIDGSLHRLWRGDTEITLPSRQFEVIEFMIRRAGQVQSKTAILAGVWRHDFDGDPNIVEVYIGRLRKAIDEPFNRRSIETVRGAGYRLVDDRPAAIVADEDAVP